MSEPEYFKVAKPGNKCLDCDVDLRLEERHPSVMTEEHWEAADAKAEDADMPNMRRQDYCAECWAKVKDEGYFSFWLSRRKPSAMFERERKKFRKARLLDLFIILYDSNHPDDLTGKDIPETWKAEGETRIKTWGKLNDLRTYVISQLLMHLKVLQLIEDEKATQEGLIKYSSRTVGRIFSVKDFGWGKFEMDEIQQDIEAFVSPPEEARKTKSRR
jgi:hypothetical protein